MVAGELALGGVHPIVVDSLAESSAEPKANSLVGQVIRMFHMRGLYHEFGGAPGAPHAIPGYMFGRMLVPSLNAYETARGPFLKQGGYGVPR